LNAIFYSALLDDYLIEVNKRSDFFQKILINFESIGQEIRKRNQSICPILSIELAIHPIKVASEAD